MTAFREEGRVVVVVPGRMSERQVREQVPGLVARFEAREARSRPPRGDAELTQRAGALYDAYLRPEVGPAPPFGVRWVPTMAHRWGSCSTGTGEIRVSDRLMAMPSWVVDYVLLHEVTHLVEHGHTPRFWTLVGAYPQTARARGFLEGVDFAVASGPGSVPLGP